MELNEKQIETICESVRKVLGKAKITKQPEAKKQMSKLVPGSSTLTGDKK